MRACHRFASPPRGSPAIAFFSLKSLPAHFARFPPRTASTPLSLPRLISMSSHRRTFTASAGSSPLARSPPFHAFPPLHPIPRGGAKRGREARTERERSETRAWERGVSASDATPLCTLPLSPDLLRRAGISRSDFYPSFGCAPPCFFRRTGWISRACFSPAKSRL